MFADRFNAFFLLDFSSCFFLSATICEMDDKNGFLVFEGNFIIGQLIILVKITKINLIANCFSKNKMIIKCYVGNCGFFLC